MPRWFLLTLSLILAAAWLYGDDGGQPGAAAPKPTRPAASVAGLQGRALAITIKSDPTYGIYLEDARIVELGGRPFLVGLGVDSGAGEWTAGRRSWVAVDDISEIVEFDSVEELRKTLEPADERPDA